MQLNILFLYSMPVIAVSFTLWHHHRKARAMSPGERMVILLSLAFVAGWALAMLDMFSARMEESYVILLFYFLSVSALLLMWWGIGVLSRKRWAWPSCTRSVLALLWDLGRFAHYADLRYGGLPLRSAGTGRVIDRLRRSWSRLRKLWR